MSSARDIPGEKEHFRVRGSVILLAIRLLAAVIGIIALAVLFAISGRTIPQSAVLITVVVVVGTFILSAIFLYWYAAIYRLTSKRVEARRGVLGVKEQEISLNDVEHVAFSQGILGTIFNYGDITVRSAARDDNLSFDGIAMPKRRTEMIEDLAMIHGRRHR